MKTVKLRKKLKKHDDIVKRMLQAGMSFVIVQKKYSSVIEVDSKVISSN